METVTHSTGTIFIHQTVSDVHALKYYQKQDEIRLKVNIKEQEFSTDIVWVGSFYSLCPFPGFVGHRELQ